MVGHEWHADDEEADVAEGQVQEELVDRRVHLAFRNSHPDDQGIPHQAEQHYHGEQKRHGHLVEGEIEYYVRVDVIGIVRRPGGATRVEVVVV